jgi:hypothetical protein
MATAPRAMSAPMFTSVSADCVTGLTSVDTATYWSTFGQVVIMALIQVGSSGIMTLATLLGLPVGGRLKLKSSLIAQAETHTLNIGDVVPVQAVSLPLHRLGRHTLGDPLGDGAFPHAEDAGGLGGAEPLAGPGRVLVHDRQRRSAGDRAPSRIRGRWTPSRIPGRVNGTTTRGGWACGSPSSVGRPDCIRPFNGGCGGGSAFEEDDLLGRESEGQSLPAAGDEGVEAGGPAQPGR